MPTSIIFHPSQEKILADEQRRILKELNAPKVRFLPLYPLYCLFDPGGLSEAGTEEFKSLIETLLVLPARLKNGRLSFPVEANLRGAGISYGGIPIGRAFAQNLQQGAQGDRMFPSEKLPLEPRVFQAAEVRTDGVLWEVYRPIWIALRKK